MKKVLLAIVALSVGACEFNIADPNSPAAIGPNATPATVNAATLGILIALREDIPNWVQKSSILGREGYRLDTADPRFISELLQGPLDPSNNAFGGGQWTREYRAIQGGYQILNVIGSAQISDLGKEGVRGFVQTIQALAFLMVLNAHIQDSIPIDVNRSIDQPLAPFVSNDSAYKHVLSKLDSARTHLLAAGTAFVFDPGPGFTGFNTPATFLQVNRALKARVLAYRASLGALPAGAYTRPAVSWSSCAVCWDSVVTALGQSFMDTTQSLDLGAYMAFGTGNQDTPNALSQNPASAVNLAHPFIRDSAELQTGGTLRDRRFLAKTTVRVPALSLSGHTSNLSWTRYPTPISPIPIIRNEELILLAAEANWFAATGSKLQAVADLNFIRRTSGNLPPTTVTAASTDAAFVNALLHERLYSLLYENGHRWIDMRRYGRLSQVLIDVPGDTVFSSMPVNVFEVNARQ